MKMTTAAQLREYIERQKLNAYDVARNTFRAVGNEIIETTPVDTGFARGSWTFSENSTTPPFRSVRDTNGAATQKAFENGVDASKDGSTLYLLTNLVYMPPLEYGHSKQKAPNGMVRKAIMNFQRELNERINELRRNNRRT